MKLKRMFAVLCVFCVMILVGLDFQTAANAADYLAKSVPVYRLKSFMLVDGGPFGGQNDSVMMTSVAEMNNALQNGWKSDGIACWTSPAQIPGTVPLYRMYKPSASDHFYVSTKSERDSAVGLGYSQEGIVGYVYPKNINPPVPGTVPLYRFYSGGQFTYHRYSLDPQGAGYEGIECYVWPSEKGVVSMSLTSPRAYEELKGLSEYSIAWNSSVKGGYVALYYSTDSGNNWTQITSGVTNTGIAKWKVPNVDTQRGRIRIVWTDNLYGTSNLLARVESPYDFKIKRTTLMPSSKPPTAIKR